MNAASKPVVRVKSGTYAFPDARPQANIGGSFNSFRSGYLRDSRSGVIAARPASLSMHRDEVRRVWWRAAALAMDLIQNSGRLRGVADQLIVESCGVELSLNYRPNLKPFGYDDKEAAEFVRMVKNAYRVWCWDARECHGRGQWSIPQQADISIRNWLAFGESCGIIDFMSRSGRNRYGVTTGTKFSVFSPMRLVQDTSISDRLFQGVIRDENGRVDAYRCETWDRYICKNVDYPARDRSGRQLFVHAFDPFSAEDERGISPLAATIRKYLMGENVDDATAQMKFLQTVYAITLTSDRPSAEAFEALEALKDNGGDALSLDFMNYFKAQLDRAAEGEIRVGSDPGISHLAPGEKLSFESANVPGADHMPFRAAIDRETARSLGTTYGGYTLDYTQATYASTNMENASIYPLAVRRTDRIVAPNYLVPFQSWLDESIGEGRIPFKGGYEVFAKNREALCWATCIGPSKPTADDQKRDLATTERLLNGTGSFEDECAALGRDPEEVFESRVLWHKRYIDAGMPSPFERKQGSQPVIDGGKNKAAA